ncbi:hypothetical protein J2S47_005156 [Streptomyces griseoviridis]|uniref:Polynucleotide kinase-phosphatase ligase domain-containing protein n=1 Tax=Streptomyces griseoviridis TaxID=45398 RepID=A0ABT9LMA5_STRGD|nr:hypothetical protein [Streptomyces griseoviridis]
MFLTVTTTGTPGRPATDLGFLPHKHPEKAQAFATSSGTAHVFHPEADQQRCTAALLLEADAVALVRRGRGKGRGGAPDAALAQYVNDRPYAASSLLAVALSAAFSSAPRGVCAARPERAAEPLPLRAPYAAVGAASGAVFPGALAALEGAAARGVDATGLLERQRGRAADAAAFTDAYRRYCWPTRGLDGVRLAPFQLLAVQGRGLAALPHDEQLALIDRVVEHDGSGPPHTTRRLYADTGDPGSGRAGVDWWREMTGRGGEGMVVKPVGALVRDERGRLVQPGVKCRGREYLRIVYGPEYTRPENLARLRQRSLHHKRSLAAREYALGLEALDRLADGEPLWRVHEAVFGVLALEPEPVDPRLGAAAARPAPCSCGPAGPGSGSGQPGRRWSPSRAAAVAAASSGRRRGGGGAAARSWAASRSVSRSSGWVSSVVASAIRTSTV